MEDKEMDTITLNYRNDEVFGSVSMEANNDSQHYTTLGPVPDPRYWITGSVCLVEMKCRYINFMDNNDIVKAKFLHGIQTLDHKRSYKYAYRQVHGFDHTTGWRRKGDKFPLFILTEPYCKPNEEELECWNDYCKKWGLKFKIFPPSQKSLWNDSTYMIFWWCPKYYTFEENLMKHDDFDDLKKRLTYKKRTIEKRS